MGKKKKKLPPRKGYWGEVDRVMQERHQKRISDQKQGRKELQAYLDKYHPVKKKSKKRTEGKKTDRNKKPQKKNVQFMGANYRAYLDSEKWRKRSKFFRSEIGFCEVCQKDEFLHSHHLTYCNVGRETMDDIAVLCDICHESYHSKYRVPPSFLNDLSRNDKVSHVFKTVKQQRASETV